MPDHERDFVAVKSVVFPESSAVIERDVVGGIQKLQPTLAWIFSHRLWEARNQLIVEYSTH